MNPNANHFLKNICHLLNRNCDITCFYAVVPLPDFLKIGSSVEIWEVGIEIIIKKRVPIWWSHCTTILPNSCFNVCFYSGIQVLYPLNLNNYEVTLNKESSISRRLRDYSFLEFHILTI